MSTSRMISIENVDKYFGDAHVVRDATFHVNEGEFLSLLGPSGCGKTTILRMIAGLETVSNGTITLAGKDVTFIPPFKRDIGLVFQNYALFPHMNVERNLMFGLEMRKAPKEEMSAIVQRILTLINLKGYEKRMPLKLSGGEQQRVALGRALAIEPVVLLLDEPLSNLDAKLREKMRIEIKRIQNKVGITTIFVTHDQEEALTLSDRIIVMSGGEIVEDGSPIEIYLNPKCAFTGEFMGHSNILVGKVTGIEKDNFVIQTGEDLIFHVSAKPGITQGDEVYVFLRHENVQVNIDTGERDSSTNAIPAEVQMVTFLGPAVEYICIAGGIELHARQTSEYSKTMFKAGQSILLQWDPSDCILLRC